MQSNKSLNQILKETRSASMNKWIGIIQEETEISSIGETPTEKMTDLISHIKTAIAARLVCCGLGSSRKTPRQGPRQNRE